MSYFILSPVILLLKKLLISSNKMKAVLFLSFFIVLVDLTFSTLSGIYMCVCVCIYVCIYICVCIYVCVCIIFVIILVIITYFFIFVETAETIDSAFQAIDDQKNVVSGMCKY